MDLNNNYSELIDTYLAGGMSESAKVAFEEALQKDPLLQGEFQLQQGIVVGIKDFRKAELKAMLNNVEVGGAFSTFKIAAGIGALLIGGMSFYYFNADKAEPIAELPVPTKIEEATPTASKENLTVVTDEIEPVVEANSEITDDEVVVAGKKSKTVKSKAKEVRVVQLPTVVEDFNDDENPQLSEQLTLPDNNLSTTHETIIAKTDVNQITDSKYSFHYQFINNKLFLYGDFDKKYEILELNSPNGISIYMFYDGYFYGIAQQKKKITPLTKIEDSDLINDLMTIKK
jgi:hypothetical protein